ncbi:hypothetical protein [Rossellomorea yichunensis]|uniref:hypothetical protein n=1 Tax=Rossellomorea yichunensis TaxID=3077331 RepID=UPI0028DFDAC5|nr:hypothetical protein [Rossellomorea sp. YC4-1]MDT9027431.1 hypothetical protein [Rossellomorea sp. YC4-1]
MVEDYDDYTRKYSDHHDDEEHCEGDPDEQEELCSEGAGEKEEPGNQDLPETDENCTHEHEEHCSNQDLDDLPCKSVEGVLNSMFQLGDHLEVFFEDEMIDSGGTFVAAFDNILIWMDYNANVNFTDLCGPISVRKIGSKRKKNRKHYDKNKNEPKHKGDNQIEKKKKGKSEKKEQGPRKKAEKNKQSDVNEELLNFVKLEKEEHETEGMSQESLNLQHIHEDNETIENESITVEIVDSSGDEGEDYDPDSVDEKVGVINLLVEDYSNDSGEEEEEYTPPLETDEDHSEEKESDAGNEEKAENESDSQEVLEVELAIDIQEESQASSLVEEFESQEETLFSIEESPSEDTLEHSLTNSPLENDKE